MSSYWKRKPTWTKDLIVLFEICVLLIDWLSLERRGFVWNWTSKVMEWTNFECRWTRDGGGSWKLSNFHWRLMCIIPKLSTTSFTNPVLPFTVNFSINYTSVILFLLESFFEQCTIWRSERSESSLFKYLMDSS